MQKDERLHLKKYLKRNAKSNQTNPRQQQTTIVIKKLQGWEESVLPRTREDQQVNKNQQQYQQETIQKETQENQHKSPRNINQHNQQRNHQHQQKSTTTNETETENLQEQGVDPPKTRQSRRITQRIMKRKYTKATSEKKKHEYKAIARNADEMNKKMKAIPTSARQICNKDFGFTADPRKPLWQTLKIL